MKNMMAGRRMASRMGRSGMARRGTAGGRAGRDGNGKLMKIKSGAWLSSTNINNNNDGGGGR